MSKKFECPECPGMQVVVAKPRTVIDYEEIDNDQDAS